MKLYMCYTKMLSARLQTHIESKKLDDRSCNISKNTPISPSSFSTFVMCKSETFQHHFPLLQSSFFHYPCSSPVSISLGVRG